MPQTDMVLSAAFLSAQFHPTHALRFNGRIHAADLPKLGVESVIRLTGGNQIRYNKLRKLKKG